MGHMVLSASRHRGSCEKARWRRRGVRTHRLGLGQQRQNVHHGRVDLLVVHREELLGCERRTKHRLVPAGLAQRALERLLHRLAQRGLHMAFAARPGVISAHQAKGARTFTRGWRAPSSAAEATSSNMKDTTAELALRISRIMRSVSSSASRRSAASWAPVPWRVSTCESKNALGCAVGATTATSCTDPMTPRI